MADDFEPDGPYHLPEIPADLGIDPTLAALVHVAAFLELSGDDTVGFDEALEALEAMSAYLQRLTLEQAESVKAQLKKIAVHGERNGWPPEAVQVARKFLSNSGVGE